MLIVEDGVVEQRTVKVGFKSLEFVEILDGLSGGEQVIVADQDTFRAGAARAGRSTPTRPSPRNSPAVPCAPPLYIGLRFTASRKRSLVFNLLGVIFGVAFFIVHQAQTQGFEQYFISTILGTSGAIVISDRFQNRYTTFDNAEGSTVLSGQQRRKYYEGITDAAEIMRVARHVFQRHGLRPASCRATSRRAAISRRRS